MEDINRLIAGRQLIDDTRKAKAEARKHDDMQARFTELIKSRDEALKELGFESIDAFVKFNNAMELEGVKRWFEYVKTCDHCEGYEGTPPCAETCGADSWFNTWTGSEKDINTLYAQLITLARKYPYYEEVKEKDISNDTDIRKLVKSKELIAGRKAIKVGTIFKAGVCPGEHGFFIKVKMIPEFGYWQ